MLSMFKNILYNFSDVVSFYNQSVNDQQITFISLIDNKVQHIQEELMWERIKLKCNTYNTPSPFLITIVGNK